MWLYTGMIIHRNGTLRECIESWLFYFAEWVCLFSLFWFCVIFIMPSLGVQKPYVLILCCKSQSIFVSSILSCSISIQYRPLKLCSNSDMKCKYLKQFCIPCKVLCNLSIVFWESCSLRCKLFLLPCLQNLWSWEKLAQRTWGIHGYYVTPVRYLGK